MNAKALTALAMAIVLGFLFVLGTAAFNPRPVFAAPDEIDLAGGPSHSSAQVNSGCNSLTLDRALSKIPSFAGSPSMLAYGCGDGGASAAFTTGHSHSTKKLTLTPVFTLPQGWSLGIGVVATSGECSSGVVGLSSGTSLDLSPDTGYVYCLSTTSASSFSSFSVSWTR